MIDIKKLKPVTIVDLNYGFVDGYMYQEKFIPKGFGSMNDWFVENSFKGYNIFRKLARKANVAIEKIDNKHNIDELDDWYEIIEK